MMPDSMANNIVRICAQSEVAPDSAKAFEVGDKRLAVFNIGGRFYVTDDECTHASASLADGMLEGDGDRMCDAFGGVPRADRGSEGAALRGGAAHLQSHLER